MWVGNPQKPRRCKDVRTDVAKTSPLQGLNQHSQSWGCCVPVGRRVPDHYERCRHGSTAGTIFFLRTILANRCTCRAWKIAICVFFLWRTIACCWGFTSLSHRQGNGDFAHTTLFPNQTNSCRQSICSSKTCSKKAMKQIPSWLMRTGAHVSTDAKIFVIVLEMLEHAHRWFQTTGGLMPIT